MAEKLNGLSPDLIIHPGVSLAEILSDRKMSQKELAARTDVSEAHVSNIIKGQKGISISYARKLQYALGINSSFWSNLQSNYDSELEIYREFHKITPEELNVAEKLKPLAIYLQKSGIVDRVEKGTWLVLQLRELFNICNLERLPDVQPAGAYRLTGSRAPDLHMLAAWHMVCGLLLSVKPIEKALDTERLEKIIPDIKALMFRSEAVIMQELRPLLGNCGVNFILIPSFVGLPVKGLIKKYEGNKLALIMTNHQKFADIFWFTLFHEIGHILNGDVGEEFTDYEESFGAENEKKEKDADLYAASRLIAPDRYKEFVKQADFSEESLRTFCAKENIPTFILIGRLQREGLLSYRYKKPTYHFSENWIFREESKWNVQSDSK